jgi:hypothetical protein
MDLAMPGIDGWETLRRLRAHWPGHAGGAVVSANAFDKGLDNDVGIRRKTSSSSRCAWPSCWTGWAPAGLQWVTLDARPPPAGPARRAARATLRRRPGAAALQQACNLGYVRGIGSSWTPSKPPSPATPRFVARLRAMARQFQFRRHDRPAEESPG